MKMHADVAQHQDALRSAALAACDVPPEELEEAAQAMACAQQCVNERDQSRAATRQHSGEALEALRKMVDLQTARLDTVDENTTSLEGQLERCGAGQSKRRGWDVSGATPEELTQAISDYETWRSEAREILGEKMARTDQLLADRKSVV